VGNVSAILGACLGVCASFSACTPQPAPVTPRYDPAVAELERLLQRSSPGEDLQGCLARAREKSSCAAPSRQRTFPVKVALDPRYQRQWPHWRRRLKNTFGCVNRLYTNTGVRWRISTITPWDPKEHRHQLYPLLHRLRHEVPPEPGAFRLGISVWEERRIYRVAGGEIGLSQAGACVVPSWPRVENDCVIMAHELGHLIGARHVPGKHWVMGWAAHPFHLPAANPLARVIATYRFHPRNVLAMNVHAGAPVTPQGVRVSPVCAAMLTTVDRCYGF